MLGLSFFLAVVSLFSPQGAVIERHVAAMGTTFSLVVEAATSVEAIAASEAAVRGVEATEARLSTWSEQSELSRLNRAGVGEPVCVSVETTDDLTAAWRCSASTGGAFEARIGPVLEAWAVREDGRVPTSSELDAALARMRSSQIVVQDRGRVAWQEAVGRIEEGGFGKGAGLDRAAADLMAAAPAARAWMSLGGQVLLAGGSQPWEVSIADPRDRGLVALTLRLHRGSISTSGNSEQAMEIDGKRYGHLIDPRTGYPALDFGSLTVLAEDGLSADCLSTGLYVLGPDQALCWAAGHPEVEVLILEPRGDRLRARLTPGLAEAVISAAEQVDVEVFAGCRP